LKPASSSAAQRGVSSGEERATAPQIRHIWQPSSGIRGIDSAALQAGPEIPGIRRVWQEQRELLKGTQALADFSERLSREWAIETGILEGLYDIDRGVTKTLIEQGFRAELLDHGATNRPREFVLRLIRDQKDALDGVFDFVKGERHLSTSWIKELHAALLRSQEITEGIDALGRHVEIPLIRGDWKKQPNSPVREGITYAYCPPEHIPGEMERLVSIHKANREEGISAEVMAAWLHHRFTQIHPFQDGNGRVARTLASLVLVQEGLFPLVVTRDHRITYLDTLEAADSGNLQPLVNFIVTLQKQQFIKATEISAATLSQRTGIKSILSRLVTAAERTTDSRRMNYDTVASTARRISEELCHWLDDYRGEIESALQRMDASSQVWISQANEKTDRYFRSQIVETARDRLGYFANLREFRHWVSLNMYWRRRAKLVFAIHGIGREFNGALICAPFLEFRDSDEEDAPNASLVPVADEGFLLFHNETLEDARRRFAPWRDAVFGAAMRALTENL